MEILALSSLFCRVLYRNQTMLKAEYRTVQEKTKTVTNTKVKDVRLEYMSLGPFPFYKYEVTGKNNMLVHKIRTASVITCINMLSTFLIGSS